MDAPTRDAHPHTGRKRLQYIVSIVDGDKKGAGDVRKTLTSTKLIQ